MLRAYTLSPHFVSTLCRIRFVSTLRPHALSLYASSPHFVPTLCRKRKSTRMFRLPVRFRCALEPAVSVVLRKLPPALDPRQPHRVLWTTASALPTATAYCHCLLPLPTATAYCYLPCLLSPPVPKHPARRPGTSSRYSYRKVGRAVPVTPLRGVTGEPHTE